jgi:sugar phosphate permease
MMHKPHHLTRYTDEPREPQESADPRRWKALAVLSLAQFMLILDLTVVNVALPNLGADLDLSRTAFTWAVSAYTLFFGGLMLLGGRFADVFGSRPVMLTGLVIFTLASLASGLAQGSVRHARLFPRSFRVGDARGYALRRDPCRVGDDYGARRVSLQPGGGDRRCGG